MARPPGADPLKYYGNLLSAGRTQRLEEVGSRSRRSGTVVTKSLASTPFGKKVVYRIDGECIWSEYVSFAPSRKEPHLVHFRVRASRMLGQLKRGFCTALSLKSS